MKCNSVQKRLAGYLDGAVRSSERARVQQHLDSCAACREELQRYRKLSLLLSRTTPVAPPPDLAVRIRVAAAQERAARETSRLRAWWQHLGVRFENGYRPLALPATGGLFSAMIIFIVALQLIVPGITVRAVQNDVPVKFMQPAELVSLSEYPMGISAENETEMAFPHGLLVDVTVDGQGQMVDYEILSGPDGPDVRRQLNQVLLFARFRPMMSFGRYVPGGHVLLTFSEVRVRG